jgi:hypothetical protein
MARRREGPAAASGATATPFAADWQQENLAALDNAVNKRGLRLV